MDAFYNTLGNIVSTSLEFTLDAALEMFNFAVWFLPNSDGFPSQVDTAFATLGSQLAFLNFYLPVDTIVTIIGLFVSLQLIVIMYKLSLRLISMIRGVDMHSGVNADFSPTDYTLDMRSQAGSGDIDMRRK